MDRTSSDRPVEGSRITVSPTVPVEELVDWFERDGIAGSRTILSEAMAAAVDDKFPLNSKLRGLLDGREMQIRTVTESNLPTIIATEEAQFLEVEFGDLRQFVELEREGFYHSFAETFDTEFEDADPLDLDVPPWEELLEQLEEMVGPETRKQYVRLIETAAANDIDSVDEVAVAIIATALSGDLLYDISKWGEDMNIASKASFSRRKTKLEDDGVISTEKVPVEVGRPRLRLRLGERVGGLSMNIGVSSQDIHGSNPIESDETADKGDPQRTTSDESDSVDSTGLEEPVDFIAELDAELKQLLSSDESS